MDLQAAAEADRAEGWAESFIHYRTTKRAIKLAGGTPPQTPPQCPHQEVAAQGRAPLTSWKPMISFESPEFTMEESL